MNSRKLTVSDADVLIHLSKLNMLTNVAQIYKILIPEPIKNEILNTKTKFFDQKLILDEIKQENIEICNIQEKKI